jgi:hypothetical protein
MSIVASHIPSREFVWDNILERNPSAHMDFRNQPFSTVGSFQSPVESTFSFEPKDEDDDYERGMQTTSLSIYSAPSEHNRPFGNVEFPFAVSGKSFESHLPVPFSFPRPDASCFIANYAPNEPLILLPNNFTVSGSLDQIVTCLEENLSGGNITFTSSGSSWSGACMSEYGVRCTFRICVYKSKKFTGQHIIEVQRTGGDGFVFGKFYNNLKIALRL